MLDASLKPRGEVRGMGAHEMRGCWKNATSERGRRSGPLESLGHGRGAGSLGGTNFLLLVSSSETLIIWLLSLLELQPAGRAQREVLWSALWCVGGSSDPRVEAE